MGEPLARGTASRRRALTGLALPGPGRARGAQYTSAWAPSARISTTNVVAPAMRTPSTTSSSPISRRAAHCVHSVTLPPARTAANRSGSGVACGSDKSGQPSGSANHDARGADRQAARSARAPRRCTGRFRRAAARGRHRHLRLYRAAAVDRAGRGGIYPRDRPDRRSVGAFYALTTPPPAPSRAGGISVR